MTIESDSDKQANQIHDALMSMKFYNWYTTGNWDKYISSDEEAPSHFEIIKQIKELFKIN